MLSRPIRDEERDTVNAIDGIAEQAGEGAYAAIREQKDRYVAALVVGVDPDAEWTESGQGMDGGLPRGRPRAATALPLQTAARGGPRAPADPPVSAARIRPCSPPRTATQSDRVTGTLRCARRDPSWQMARQPMASRNRIR